MEILELVALIVGIAVGVITILGVVYYAGGVHRDIKANRKDTETMQQDIVVLKTDVRGLSERVDGTNRRLDDNNHRLGETNQLVRVLIDSVNRLAGGAGSHPQPPNPSVKIDSPMSLTDYGEKLIADTKADALAEKYADNIKTTDDMNDYRIQEACFDYAYAKLLAAVSDEERDLLEGAAFQRGLPMGHVLQAIGVRLRDYKFQQHGRKVGKAAAQNE